MVDIESARERIAQYRREQDCPHYSYLRAGLGYKADSLWRVYFCPNCGRSMYEPHGKVE